MWGRVTRASVPSSKDSLSPPARARPKRQPPQRDSVTADAPRAVAAGASEVPAVAADAVGGRCARTAADRTPSAPARRTERRPGAGDVGMVTFLLLEMVNLMKGDAALVVRPPTTMQMGEASGKRSFLLTVARRPI
ncbi:hypothetical protein GCM10027053_17360 [Intrasporangium mesophilum]